MRHVVLISLLLCLIFSNLGAEQYSTEQIERDLSLNVTYLGADTIEACEYMQYDLFLENQSLLTTYPIYQIPLKFNGKCVVPQICCCTEKLNAEGKWEVYGKFEYRACSYGHERIELPAENYMIHKTLYFMGISFSSFLSLQMDDPKLLFNIKSGQAVDLKTKFLYTNFDHRIGAKGSFRCYFKYEYDPSFDAMADTLLDFNHPILKQAIQFPSFTLYSDTFYVTTLDNPLELKIVPRKVCYTDTLNDLTEIIDVYLINKSDRSIDVDIHYSNGNCPHFSANCLPSSSTVRYPPGTGDKFVTLSPGERVKLFADRDEFDTMLSHFRPIYSGECLFNLWWNHPSSNFCEILSNTVKLDIRDTVPDEFLYSGSGNISRDRIIKNLKINAELMDSTLYLNGRDFNFNINVKNISNRDTFAIFKPYGRYINYEGRIKGSIDFEMETWSNGNWKEMKHLELPECGCDSDLWCETEIISLPPGDSVKVNHSCSPFYMFALNKIGRYRITVIYQMGYDDEFDKLKKEIKKKTPFHILAHMPKFKIKSEPMEFEIKEN